MSCPAESTRDARRPATAAAEAAAAPARADRRRDARRRPGDGLAAGCRPSTRWARRPPSSSSTDLPGFAPPAVAGHAGRIRSVRAGDRDLLVFLGRTHFYEGLGVRAVVHGVRTAAAAGLPRRRADQRLRRPAGDLAARHAGADQRPHQPDRHLTDRGRQLRRPHRPLLPAAARAVPRGRRRPSTRASTSSCPGRTTRPRPRSAWSARSAATWSACRRRSRRSPPARPGLEVLGISLVTNLAAGITGEPLRPRGGPGGRPGRRQPDGRPARRDRAADLSAWRAYDRRRWSAPARPAQRTCSSTCVAGWPRLDSAGGSRRWRAASRSRAEFVARRAAEAGVSSRPPKPSATAWSTGSRPGRVQ